jgi:hypothetical protein
MYGALCYYRNLSFQMILLPPISPWEDGVNPKVWQDFFRLQSIGFQKLFFITLMFVAIADSLTATVGISVIREGSKSRYSLIYRGKLLSSIEKKARWFQISFSPI